jgi:hypothetical protein
MKKSAYQRHLEHASTKGATWTEQEILSVRMSIHKLPKDDALTLIMAINEGGFQITQEQSDKGIEFLRRKLFTAKGKRRNTEFTRRLNNHVIKLIEGFSHFTFEGVHYEDQGSRIFTSPIYRVHDSKGNYFDYTMPFGGSPEVLYVS